MSRKPTLAIGVFLPEPVQLMDLSAIDLFYMMTPEYLTACRLPAPMISQGVAFDIHYIGRANNNSHCQLTAAANLRLTKTTKDPEVQPGKLDIILVPGPDPSTIADEEIKGFLHSHANWTGPKGERTDILSVCTGCTLLAQSGILVGKKASAPRLLVPSMRKEYSRTTWIDDKRWVADANIWSSGKVDCKWRGRIKLNCLQEASQMDKRWLLHIYVRSFQGRLQMLSLQWQMLETKVLNTQLAGLWILSGWFGKCSRLFGGAKRRLHE